MMDTDTSVMRERIGQLCHQFKLPTMGAQSVARFTEAGHGDALATFLEVLEQEAEDRRHRRINRLRQASRLPSGKTWETFEHDRMPLALRQQLDQLAKGSFVEHGVNVLAFGLPGTGKTHALCALGHRLVETGHSVLFAPAYRLVQDLLAAKRDFALPRQLRKLDNFDFLLLDDLGYLPQGNEESEVLFTLIAERYERRSLGITSNLVFSEWERIFANPMATAAAIDRVVHHSVTLEFDVPSYRTDAAQQRGQSNDHLFDVYLGECIAPCTVLDPLKAALPVHRPTMTMPLNHDDCEDNKHDACRLAVAELHPSMERRWNTAAEMFRQVHENQAIKDLYSNLNYLNKLTSQLEYLRGAIAGDKTVRVAYTQSGQPTVAVVHDSNAILDRKLYQTKCQSEDEAYYVLAVINSEELAAGAATFMTKGLYGARDFEKHGWKLPIPRYDAKTRCTSA